MILSNWQCCVKVIQYLLDRIITLVLSICINLKCEGSLWSQNQVIGQECERGSNHYISTNMAIREWNITLAVLLGIPFHHGAVGDLREKPENAAEIVGISVVLRCQGASDSSTFVTWQIYLPGSSEPTVIAIDGVIGNSPNKNLYSISGDASIKEYNLVINLQLAVAGRYRCIELLPTPPPKGLAHVTVLGTSPVCSSTMQENIIVNEVVTYTCEVTYSNSTINWAPVMSLDGPGNPSAVNQSTDGRVKFSIEVTGTPELNEAVYSARTYFESFSALPEDHAVNIPDYSDVHTFPPLVVLYPPRNIVMDNEKESYLPGEMITCSAYGNPTVSYRWYNRTADSVYQPGAQLTITTEMDGHDFGCEAFNEIRGFEKTLSKDITLVVSPSSGPSPGVVAGIVIAVIFSLGTLVVSVVILWQIRRGPCKKCKEGSKHPQPTNFNSSHGIYETPDNSGMTLQQPEYAQLQLK